MEPKGKNNTAEKIVNSISSRIHLLWHNFNGEKMGTFFSRAERSHQSRDDSQDNVPDQYLFICCGKGEVHHHHHYEKTTPVIPENPRLRRPTVQGWRISSDPTYVLTNETSLPPTPPVGIPPMSQSAGVSGNRNSILQDGIHTPPVGPPPSVSNTELVSD